jgi:small subunit ribosomal protein S6
MTTRLYEGMFLLDNQVVRDDWKAAKALVTDLIAKHGGKLHTARRWDERRLAYDITRKRRATYLLAYYEVEQDAITALVRDLELSEPILRHLLLQVEVVPETERELAGAEDAADFQIPAPPPDDHVEEQETHDEDPDERYERPRGRRPRDDEGSDDSNSDADGDEGGDDDAKSTARKTDKVGARASKED